MSVLTAFLSFVLSSSAILPQQETATDIIKKSDEIFRGESSYAEMKMTIERKTWTREIEMKAWSLTTEYSLVLITAPARDEGVAFLKRGKEMWNWQPAIDRSIKMPPSMMSQSWMGSDFTNDDLVQQSSIVNDFTHTLIGEEELEDRMCHKIELIPNEDAAVVWGKIIMWVDQTDYLQLKSEFYDEDMELVNTMLGQNVQDMNGRIIPTKMEVTPADKPDQHTIIEYTTLEWDTDVTEEFFTTQNMKKVK